MTPEQLACFDSDDPGIGLFHACLTAGAPMPFEPGMRVLEVGCCEADWLHRAHEAFPDVEFVGIDWRAPDVVDGDGTVTRKKANGLDPDLFPPESFDAIVSLSAIEHFGLGHYSKDPVDTDGDSVIVANCWRWLKPEGWFYFDVPYDPTGYRVAGTEYRVYDDDAIYDRLARTGVTESGIGCDWLERFVGYVHAKTFRALIPKPTASVDLFYYCAMVWQKYAPQN